MDMDDMSSQPDCCGACGHETGWEGECFCVPCTGCGLQSGCVCCDDEFMPFMREFVTLDMARNLRLLIAFDPRFIWDGDLPSFDGMTFDEEIAARYAFARSCGA